MACTFYVYREYAHGENSEYREHAHDAACIMGVLVMSF
jgi:hypothetical protein